MARMGSLAAQDGYDPNAFDVPGEQSTGVGWANKLGEILTARPQYDETVQYKTASPLVNITEGDIGRATEAAMGVSGGGMSTKLTPNNVFGLNTRGGTYYEVLKNPSKGDLLSAAKDYPTMGRDAPQMRVMKSGDDVYAWPASYATHDDISANLKLGKIPFDARDNLSVKGSKLFSEKNAPVDWNNLFSVPEPPGIRAYHSSPHDFDKFDLAKIGSGEGAQAYGHGLYFAESPAVSGQGGQYWQQFHGRMPESNPDRLAAYYLSANDFDRAKAIKYMRDIDPPQSPIHRERFDAALKQLEGNQIVGPRTYEVNINADPAHMLDWDKPLREQAELRSKMEPLVLPHLKDTFNKNVDAGIAGANAYRNYIGGSDVGASQIMRDYAGIPGIKYLDQGSRITSPVAERILDKAGSRAEALKVAEERLRTAGMGDLAYWDSMVKQFQPETSNFVIFDPNIIRIDKKYAVPGAIGAGGMGALAAQDNYQPEGVY